MDDMFNRMKRVDASYRRMEGDIASVDISSAAASIAISLKRIADALDVLKSKQERVDLPTPPETVTGRDGMPLADIRALK